jgi:hypothetical protein
MTNPRTDEGIWILDKELAVWLDRPLEALRAKLLMLSRAGLLYDVPTKIQPGPGPEGYYCMRPLDAWTVTQHFNKGTPHVVKEKLRQFLHASKPTTFTHAEFLDGELSKAQEEIVRLKEELDVCRADIAFSDVDYSLDYPEVKSRGFLQVGRVRAMWHAQRIFVRFPRESRHTPMRIVREWQPTESAENHDFMGLKGVDLRTALPLCYFDSFKRPHSIVLGFLVPEEMPEEDYEELAKAIAHNVAEFA